MKLKNLNSHTIRSAFNVIGFVPNKSNIPILGFNVKLPIKMAEDVYNYPKPNFSYLNLGERINSGVDANVFEIKGLPNFVLRLEHGATFYPHKLKLTPRSDNLDLVVASNFDGSAKILKKMQGKPLYEKDWELYRNIGEEKYFLQLKELENVPDDAFVQYYNDLITLRRNDYMTDRINPNNILYDEKNKRFNIVDITKNKKVSPEVTIKDFYPFVDEARMGNFYRKSSDLTRYNFAVQINNFFNRLMKIFEKNSINIEMEDINYSRLQKFLELLKK